MRIVVVFLCFIFTTNVFSQEKNKNQKKHSRVLMSLKHYKQKFKKPLTKEDSLSFVYKDNDTMVVLKNYKPKGVRVGYEYKDDNFLKLYTKAAFYYKHDSLKNKATMKYWKDDISIFLSKSIPKKTKKEFITFAQSLVNEIDSLKIKQVKRVEDSNFIVYYSGDFEYESRMSSNKNSDYYLYWNGKNQIYKNTIRIKTDELFNEKLRLIEMKRLFFQSLGYFTFNDELDCSNYFSGCYNENSTFSNLDKALLKYHYSYGICKGTNYETFMFQHKKSKEALLKYGAQNGFLHEK